MAAISPRIPVRAASTGRWSPGHEARVLHRSYADSHLAQKAAIAAGVAFLCLFWGYAVVVAEWKALLVGVALVACVLILIDFRVGVVLLVLLMPISGSTVFPHQIGGITGLNPVNLLLAGTLVSALLHALLSRSLGGFIPRPLLWLYVVPFLIAGALGVRHVGEIPLYFVIMEKIQFTDMVGYLRDMVIKPLLLVFVALLVAAAVARMQKPERLVGPVVVSVWIMCLMALIYFLLSGANFGQLASSKEREFLSPLGLHANELGRTYAIAYALLLFTWSKTKDYLIKLALLASIGMVVVALAVTLSRGAIGGFILVSVLFLISRRQIGSLIVGATVAAAALYFLPDPVYERVTTGFGLGANAVSAGRIDGIWLPLVPDLLRSPLYGNGIGAMLWTDAVRSGRSFLVTHPHNAYLQVMLDMGLIGLALLGAYFFHLWKGFRALGQAPHLGDSMRGFYEGAAAGLVAYLMMAVADGRLTPAPEQVFLWMAIGMMYGERARRAGS